eukprot:4538972-Prorocentrum_lima.AAC.1
MVADDVQAIVVGTQHRCVHHGAAILQHLIDTIATQALLPISIPKLVMMASTRALAQKAAFYAPALKQAFQRSARNP